jgi:ceroid-lipofuscinosis MFS transporter 7
LLISNVLLCFGAALWANASLVVGLPLLFAAQFMMGLGTGSLGVTRSYVVEQTLPANRTFMLARLSALQYAGFAATPIIGLIINLNNAYYFFIFECLPLLFPMESQP